MSTRPIPPSARTCDRVWELLRRSPRGSSAEELQEGYEVRWGKTSNRMVRRAIESLIVDHGRLVGTSPDRGYYLIESRVDLDRTRADLHSRMAALKRRDDCLKESYEEKFGKEQQGDLLTKEN